MSLFKELNPDMSLDEMRRIIKENSIKAINLKKKIEAIDAIPKVESNFKFEYSIEEVKEVVEDVDGIEGEDEEFEYYYTNMKEAIYDLTDTDEMVNAIYDSMPSLDNKNYANIINRIKLELILEKNEWNEYANDEDFTTRNDAIEEQKKIDFIINTVNNHHNVKNEELSKEENKTNNLIFLKTLTGNIYAESDLSYIDSERYPEFMELLESIEYGTFKDVKRLTINPILKGTAEVRGRGTRVVFDRVGVNTYIILDIFTKKNNCDMGYVEGLVGRVANYRKEEKKIKSTLTPEIIAEHKEIYENIKKGLTEKELVKSIRGGINDL